MRAIGKHRVIDSADLISVVEGCCMRILYGVNGYGRGHATRTLAVLPALARQHQLLVLAGGDAYPAFAPEYPVVRIPTLGFAYRSIGHGQRKRSNFGTIRRNFPATVDLFCNGPTFVMVREIVEAFAPDIVISDAETWTHQVAASLKIPRIGFDHIGILAYCKPVLDPLDRVKACLDSFCYRALMGQPDRILVSSFYDATPRRPGVRVIGTLPRQTVRELTPANGAHLLVYLNRGQDQLHAELLRPLEEIGCPVHIYGTEQRGRQGRLSFMPSSNLPFLEDLASCRAVISTAGNQLVGEAIYLGKPVLAMPESCVEQRMNALAVERLGIGMRVDPRHFSLAKLKQYMDRVDRYKGNLRPHVRDGLNEALSALDRFFLELVPSWSAQKQAATTPLQVTPT